MTDTLAKRLLLGAVVVLVAALNLVGWVLWVPYRVDAGAGLGSVDCDARVEWTSDAAGTAARARFDDACDRARTDRTRTAALGAVGLAVALAAATTIPSRRLVRTPDDRRDPDPT